MQHVLKTHEDVKGAMVYDGRPVDFRYGDPGTPGQKPDRGWGVAHIVAKREWERQTYPETFTASGADMALDMVKVIANGRETRRSLVGGNVRLEIEYDGLRAVLVQENGSYLLTGFLIVPARKNPDATGAILDASGATHRAPTLNASHGGCGEAGARTNPAESFGPDLAYRELEDGLFTAFYPKTKAGERAWNQIAEQTDGTGKVLTVEVQSIVAQLRQAGYTVAPLTGAAVVSNEELLAELDDQEDDRAAFRRVASLYARALDADALDASFVPALNEALAALAAELGEPWTPPTAEVPAASLPEALPDVPRDATRHAFSLDRYGKGLVLRGDTKPYKEQIKRLGGRWNARLQGGPGWVFPEGKGAAVRAFLGGDLLPDPSALRSLSHDEAVRVLEISKRAAPGGKTPRPLPQLVHDDDNALPPPFDGLAPARPCGVRRGATHVSLDEAIKALRKALHAAFKPTRFSVRRARGTAYGYVSVSWTDGPSDALVRRVTRHFEGERFDGMDDSTHANVTEDAEGMPVTYATRGISTSRSLSRDYAERALVQYGGDKDNLVITGSNSLGHHIRHKDGASPYHDDESREGDRWLQATSERFYGTAGQKRTREETKAVREGRPDPEAAAKLRALADGMEAEIKRLEGSGTFSQRPTRRRMGIAEGIRSRIDGLRGVQARLRALANRHDAGTVPPTFAGVRTKIVALWLSGLDYSAAANEAAEKAGLDVNQRQAPRAEWQALLSQERSPEQERQRAIQKAEEALFGVKIDGFFPTPPEVVSQMLRLAGVEAGQGRRVLEPSAGSGRIADAIRASGNTAVCVEVNHRLAELLRLKGHEVVQEDFLAWETDERFEAVVMNPPFERGQDAAHVRRAYELLKPGGTLAAIVGEGLFFRKDKTAAAFRAWLEPLGGLVEKLPSGTFRLSGTDVASRLVVVEKPTAPFEVPLNGMRDVAIVEEMPLNIRGVDMQRQADFRSSRLRVLFDPAGEVAEPAYYALMRLDDLVASHHPDCSRNTAHRIAGAQPRDRSARELCAQSEAIAKALNPVAITGGVLAFDGAPVVTQEGYVIQGNGRAIALRVMYEKYPARADAYVRYLYAHAAEWGLSVDDVGRFAKPVLVRVVTVTDPRAKQLGNLVNRSEAKLSRLDEAKSFVRRLSNDQRRQIGMTLAAAHADTLREMMDEVGLGLLDYLPGLDRTGMLKGGDLTVEAKDLLRDVFVGLVFDTDDGSGIRAYQALPHLTRSGIDKSLGYILPFVGTPYDLAPHLRGAARLLHEMRAAGGRFPNVSAFLGQPDAFSGPARERFSTEAAVLAQLLLDTATQAEIVARFKHYERLASGYTSLFETAPPATPFAAFAGAFHPGIRPNPAPCPCSGGEALAYFGVAERVTVALPGGTVRTFRDRLAFMTADGTRLVVVPRRRVTRLRTAPKDARAKAQFEAFHHFNASGKGYVLDLPDDAPHPLGTANAIRYLSDKVMQPGDRKGHLNGYVHTFDAGRRPAALVGDVLVIDRLAINGRGILN